jgi:hypothetical protein
MYRNVFALTLVVAMASFALPAHSGILCDEDDDEEIVCSITRLIPRTLPAPPTATPKPAAAIPAPGARRELTVAPQLPVPRAADSETRLIETPERIGIPDIAPICRRYFPALGEMLPTPCE